MNIFFTDINPVKAAYNLDDKRVNKMITESCQMLSTTIYMLNSDLQKRYSLNNFKGNQELKEKYKSEIGLMLPCYINHPCNVWLRTDKNNVSWLIEHVQAMHKIYKNRSGKNHGAMSVFKSEYSLSLIPLPHYNQITPPANCTPYCKSISNKKQYFVDDHNVVVRAYKKFMLKKWIETDKRKPTFIGREYPSFLSDIAIDLINGKGGVKI